MGFRSAALVTAALLLPAFARAEGFAPVAGSIELQGGIATIGLPEATNGTYSAQPELRVGYFLHPAIELQLESNIRIWPLGSVSPHSAGVAGHLLWYPSLGPAGRSLYLLGGAGVARTDPPGVLSVRTFDGLARGALGYKIPLPKHGPEGPVDSNAFLTTEFRVEMVFPKDHTDVVAGIAVAFSYLL